jgi:hypothetical protein
MDYRWSLGTLIGLPLLILLAVACVVAAIIFGRKARKMKGDNDYDAPLMFWIGVACWVGLICTIGGTLWGMYPYSAEYHQWQTTQGTVEKVGSRFLSSDTEGGGSTQRFAVTFTDGRQRSCDDTRCSQIEVGDILTLSCKRAWQFTGTPGYDCNYVSLKSSKDH